MRIKVTKQRWSGLWLVLFQSATGRSRTPRYLHTSFDSALTYALALSTDKKEG